MICGSVFQGHYTIYSHSSFSTDPLPILIHRMKDTQISTMYLGCMALKTTKTVFKPCSNENSGGAANSGNHFQAYEGQENLQE